MTLESPTESLHKIEKQPILTTDRLRLRAFSLDDAERVQCLLQSKGIAANTRSIDHPYPEGAAKLWIENHEELWNQGSAAVFAIEMDLDGSTHLVGACGLQIKTADENAELGYWIGEDYWGKGIATEAARRVMEFGFEIGLHRIHACHMIHNQGSGRVLEKIGMRQEGIQKGHMKKWGVFYDVVCFGLLRSEYESG